MWHTKVERRSAGERSTATHGTFSFPDGKCSERQAIVNTLYEVVGLVANDGGHQSKRVWPLSAALGTLTMGSRTSDRALYRHWDIAACKRFSSILAVMTTSDCFRSALDLACCDQPRIKCRRLSGESDLREVPASERTTTADSP